MAVMKTMAFKGRDPVGSKCKKKVKVKLSLYRPGVAQRVPGS
jgi:hypothetical protein